eukprot:1148607-Pelagomonas_calceolata.AAC.16
MGGLDDLPLSLGRHVQFYCSGMNASKDRLCAGQNSARRLSEKEPWLKLETENNERMSKNYNAGILIRTTDKHIHTVKAALMTNALSQQEAELQRAAVPCFFVLQSATYLKGARSSAGGLDSRICISLLQACPNI